jgi:glycosyltransferase involved in cell wall biosynthesis
MMRPEAATQRLFTVFIPTYNRAYVLPRTLASVEAQSLRDFEVVIVDDGSGDGTRELVAEWAMRVPFDVCYHYQTNSGKHAAHNAMLGLARGRFVVLLDSDDILLPTALERFQRHWDDIPGPERERFAGVEGLMEYLDGRGVCGDRYPEDVLDADHIEVRIRRGVSGEKRSAIRTDVLRRFPYPVFPGERHIRPSILWDYLAEAGYRFRFFNEAVQLYERQADSLSVNVFPRRMANPRGLSFCMKEELRLHGVHLGWRQRLRLGARYVRYSLHAGHGYPRQYRDIDSKPLWLASLVPGTFDWLVDRIRMRLAPLPARR